MRREWQENRKKMCACCVFGVCVCVCDYFAHKYTLMRLILEPIDGPDIDIAACARDRFAFFPLFFVAETMCYIEQLTVIASALQH